MRTSKSNLVNFIERPTSYFKRLDAESADNGDKSKEVACSYFLTFTKIYVILIVWFRYIIDVYVSYIRQFGYMNSFKSVPEELKPFYTQVSFEEAKIQYMFKTLVSLENKYHEALHLTVVYLTNIYCTLWWVASRITKNIFTRAVVFNVLLSLCRYKIGDFMYHITLIVSAYTVQEGACRICNWFKDMFKKCLSNMWTFIFLEEVFLSILLTLVTTPIMFILFLAYRLYKAFLLPVIIEEKMSRYAKLENVELLAMVENLCEKFNFPVQGIYVSRRYSDSHSVKVRGFNDKKHIVLGWKLVEGYNLDDPITLYTQNEIAAATLRAQAEYSITTPTQDIAVEATRWVTMIMFTIFLTFGFCGGSRLGFIPSPPQVISFTMSRHLSIPIFLIVQIIKNNICRQKHFTLDNRVAAVGFGEDLISYIGKEARFTYRCPVEDPFYTMVYSERPPIIYRIRNLKSRLEIEPTSE